MNRNVTTLSTAHTLRYLYGITFTPMRTFRQLAERYGNVVHLKFWNDAVLFVNDPEAIKYILKTNSENFPRGRSIADLKPLLGEGLLLSEGEHWKSQHRLLQPVFHQHRMDAFTALLQEDIRGIVRTLDRHAVAGTAVDLEQEFIALLFSLTVRYLISPQSAMDNAALISGLRTILSQTSTKRHNWRRVKSLVAGRMVRIFDAPGPKNALSDIHRAVDRLFNDVLSGAIQPGEMMKPLAAEYAAGRLTAQQVKDEIQTVLFAGYDTVAEGLLWLVYFLSTNPRWNARVMDELSALGSQSGAGTVGLQSTPLLHACIKETLRLMPPAWAFFRTVREKDHFNGYTFPKNALIMISPYILHRNPAVWPSPETFDPEHFLGTAEIHPYHYIPFGQGPHICIGNRLALAEIHSIAVALLTQFTFTFTSPVSSIPDVAPEAIISSTRPVRTHVQRR